MFAMFLYLTLYMQNVLGYSALEAGLRFLPMTLLSFSSRRSSGKLAERLGVRWFLDRRAARSWASACCSCAASSPGDDWTALLAGFLVAGVGIGLSTRRSPPPRSASWSRAARAWRRASTRPSGRSASRPASPPGRDLPARGGGTFRVAAARTRRSAPRRGAGRRLHPRSAAPSARPGADPGRETAFVAGLNHILLSRRSSPSRAALRPPAGPRARLRRARPVKLAVAPPRPSHGQGGTPAPHGRRPGRVHRLHARESLRCTARGSPTCPRRPRAVRDLCRQAPRTREHAPFFACRTEDGAIVGFLNINEIVRGQLQERLPRLRRRRPLRAATAT